MSSSSCRATSLPIDIGTLEEKASLFSSVGFCVTGKVDDKISSLLESSGAIKKMFAGLSTTHYIAGPDPDEMKVDEAKDIFEVPVVTPDWAALSLKLGKVLPIDGFERQHKHLFSSVVITTSGIKGEELKRLWTMVTYYGGDFRSSLTSKCTHLLINEPTGKKYKAAKDKGIKVICSDWIVECINNNSIVDESKFDPCLTVEPQALTPSSAVLQAQNDLQAKQGKIPTPPTTISTPTPRMPQQGQQQFAQQQPHQQTGNSQPPPRSQFQTPAPGQQIYRQQQPQAQGQMQQMFHQRMQSPPVTTQGMMPLQQQPQQGQQQMIQQQNQMSQQQQGQIPQQQQHFQVVQQPIRGQFQPGSQIPTSGQTIYRQQQPQGQMQQIFHPRLQSPPATPQQHPPQNNQMPIQQQQQGQMPPPQGQQSQMVQQLPPQQQGQMMPGQQGQLPQHFQVVQQHPGGQAPRGQFQNIQQQGPQQILQPGQQVYRQQQPQGVQMQQMFHPRMQQSPPTTPHQQTPPPGQMTGPQGQIPSSQGQMIPQQQQQQGQIPQHFQIIQQHPGMGQPPQRGQFQTIQPGSQSPAAIQVGQQVYRQQQPQGGQMQQMFHPRMQSPPTGQQQQPPQGQMIPQGQMQQQQHMSQPQMMNQQHIQQGQGQQQHYSVVITHPQYHPNQQQQPQMVNQHGQQIHPQQNLQPGPGMQQQRPQFQQQRPGSPAHQWTQQQQVEIIQQIQRDPQIRAQWARMDTAQRQLLMQKLAQKKREELLREMLLRQTHLNQQQSLGGNQTPGSGQGSPSPQQIQISPNQQQQQPIGTPPPQNQGDKTIVIQGVHQQIGQGGILSPTMPGQQSPQIPMSPQQAQQIVMQQGHPDGQKVVQQNNLNHPNQIIHQQMINPQQKVPNAQMSPNSNNQKFLAPAPSVRPSHGVIGSPQQSPQGIGVVRTQQIFTPQVAQQQSPLRIHHVLIQPGQGQIRSQGGVMQQQGNQQKIPLMPQQQSLQPNNQWHSSQQQRGVTPGPQSPFSQRIPGPESPNGPPPQWTVRPQSQQSPQSPGGQPNVSYVQVVNSKTKTALANLLSNRLQGNSGPESNASTCVTTALTSTTSTTQAMCPSPVTSQSFQHSAPTTTQSNALVHRKALANLTNGCKTIQVNSFGATRVATSQASPTMAVPSPRPPLYVSHEPHPIIPPDGVFLGCIFFGAQKTSLNWEPIVELYGGTVVETYSSTTVTHVICESTKFPEFTQMLRDSKRLVTPYWINDIIERKTSMPPFYAWHLPRMFSPFPIEQRPLYGYNMTTTNFDAKDRSRIVAVLKQLGSSYTNYFTQFSDAVICKKPEGKKYQKAREWKKPVINIQFLNELWLGQWGVLSMIHSPKYQMFDPTAPLRFDYSLAPHLMAAWKIPIRLNPEIVEKFKRSKRPAVEDLGNEDNGCKRVKLENGEWSSNKNFKEIYDTELLSPPEIDNQEPTLEPDNEIITELPDVYNLKIEEIDQINKALTELKSAGKPLVTWLEVKRLIKQTIKSSEIQLENDSEHNTVIKVEASTDDSICESESHINGTHSDSSILAYEDRWGNIETGEDVKLLPDPEVKVEKLDILLDHSNGQLVQSVHTNKFSSRLPVVLISGFTRIYKEKIKGKVEKLGGIVTDDWKKGTHLLLKEDYITPKLFLALCRYHYIVSTDWLYQSMRSGKFLDERKYPVSHKTFEKEYGITLYDVLEKPGRQHLFKGITFFMSPGNWELKREVEAIIEAAGGCVDRNRSLKYVRDYCSKFPKRSVLITGHEDFDLMEEFLMEARRPHVINIYNHTFIWYWIANQKALQELKQPRPL